jgi:sortase A
MKQINRRVSLIKKWSLLSVVVCLICFGIYFVSKSVLLFMNGYKLVEAAENLSNSPSKVGEQDILPHENQVLYPTRPEIGDNIGELFIPKLGKRLPIIHGTNEDELEKGVGHFAGSVLPGEADNSVLAGHRDTVFRKLGEVGINDRLIVKTSAGTFIYKVRKVRIVDSDDRTVIVPMERATLTVSTCYPFSFIGPAPQRYVLVADLISTK